MPIQIPALLVIEALVSKKCIAINSLENNLDRFMMDGPPTTTAASTTTKASMTKEILVSDTLSFTAWKESGLTRDQALADCQSRGQRLANIYNESEQAGINALIIDIDGTNRAFWLGMIEDGDTPDKNGIKVCS